MPDQVLWFIVVGLSESVRYAAVSNFLRVIFQHKKKEFNRTSQSSYTFLKYFKAIKRKLDKSLNYH